MTTILGIGPHQTTVMTKEMAPVDPSEGRRALFGLEVQGTPRKKQFDREIRGLAAVSFIAFPLTALTIRSN
jgi:hypothetical protein